MAFGFQSSSPLENITLNPAYKKADQSLSDFQTGIGVVAHATLDMEQFIPHTRTALVDTIASLQDSLGGVIPVVEAHELLTKIHDILDNATAKWVGNTVCILVFLFHSASRQYCEEWASQYPFLYNFKDSIPPSKACLYGCINWSLAQAQHHSFHDLSKSLTSVRGGRTRPRTGFWFNVQHCPVLGYTEVPWQRNLTQILGQTVI